MRAKVVTCIALVVAALVWSPGSSDTAERMALVERIEWEISDTGANVIVVVKGVVHYTTHGASADAAAGLPPRAYIDLTPAHLGKDIERAPIAVNDRLVRRIRIGQFDRRTARVVVDLTEPATIQVATKERPSRLVLTLTPSRPRTSGASKPAVSAAVEGPPPAAPPPPDRIVHAPPPLPTAAAPPPEVVERAAAVPQEVARSEIPPPPEPTPPPVLATPPPALPTASPRAAPTKAAGRKRMIVVLDPGHGGEDPGARGVTDEPEKVITLAIAELVAERLASEPGVEVFLTRTEDLTLPLAQRTAIANAQGADLFLSIHVNASENPNTAGIETYTLNNTDDRATIRLAALENGLALTGVAPGEPDLAYILSDLVQTGKEDESASLAEAVQGELVGYLRGRWKKVHDLGVKRGPFYVLVGAYMPCVLTEVGFLTNETEGHRIATRRYQQDIAEGIARGIKGFLGSETASANL